MLFRSTGSDNTHLLVDAGISAKRVEAGLKELELEGSDIQGLLITHEHSDHIKGVGVLARRYGVPIYATEGTIRQMKSMSSLGTIDEGLSQDLSISTKEAKEYIERYFETYPGIKSYLDGLVEHAKEEGYVTTMYGRRRPVPELKSSNFMQRSFGERVAMNSPIQGTAADIIKIAMNRVHDRLQEERMKSRLILQVHDELLVEAKLSEADRVEEILREEMQQAASLRVPLEIDLHRGKNWYEAK